MISRYVLLLNDCRFFGGMSASLWSGELIKHTRCEAVRGRRVGQTCCRGYKRSESNPQRRQCADGGLLTAAVSVGTDHRPFWC